MDIGNQIIVQPNKNCSFFRFYERSKAINIQMGTLDVVGRQKDNWISFLVDNRHTIHNRTTFTIINLKIPKDLRFLLYISGQ